MKTILKSLTVPVIIFALFWVFIGKWINQWTDTQIAICITVCFIYFISTHVILKIK